MEKSTNDSNGMNEDAKGSYASVNGLDMYYETHGASQPLVLLHGAYMTIDAMGEIGASLRLLGGGVAGDLAGLPNSQLAHFQPGQESPAEGVANGD